MNEELYNIGVERESLRCTDDGRLALSPHPEIFESRMSNDFITTDFGEAQMELRTPVCKSTKECYNKLEEITNIVLCELKNRNELLWPYSMPCTLPDEKDFVFGNYGDYKEEHEYEMALYKKYGYKMHCISGIHVNFSINQTQYNKIKNKYNLPCDIDDAYFKIIHQFMKKAWILMYIIGATPVQLENDKISELSLRNSTKGGFGNGKNLEVNFSNKSAYLNSIEEILNSGNVLSAREVYIPIRIKSVDKNNTIQELKNNKINHLEVRLFDLNPFDKCGISKHELDFMVIFLLNCLLDDDKNELDYKQIAETGLTDEQHKILLNEFKKYRKINKEFELHFEEAIDEIYNSCKENLNTAKKIKDLVAQEGLLNGMLNLAKGYSEKSYYERYKIKEHPNLEPSTVVLIKDALSQGVNYNVLSEKNNLIELMHNGKHEYIIQATKTKKDSYIFPYITDDKFLAKKIMKENKLRVPNGIMLNNKMSKKEIDTFISNLENKKVAIKPRTTNRGVGITVFEKPASDAELRKAIKYAFKFDDDILIEEYVKGQEYRFVVIDEKCISIVCRRNASIVGDGKSTIYELLEEKNKEQWHCLLNHPMKIDEPVQDFLKLQGFTLDDIPEKDQRVFIRKNSNCSTGGESIDVTDVMPERFKKVAEKAAKLFEAKICGVDIIIDDMQKEDYVIIEINDNPGISINEWPYEGNGRKIGLEILKLLKLI